MTGGNMLVGHADDAHDDDDDGCNDDEKQDNDNPDNVEVGASTTRTIQPMEVSEVIILNVRRQIHLFNK